MRKERKKTTAYSFSFPLLATMQVRIIDFGGLVNFRIAVRKLMLWLFWFELLRCALR